MTHIVARESGGRHGLVFAVIRVAAQFATDDVVRDLFLPIAEDRQRADYNSSDVPKERSR